MSVCWLAPDPYTASRKPKQNKTQLHLTQCLLEKEQAISGLSVLSAYRINPAQTMYHSISSPSEAEEHTGWDPRDKKQGSTVPASHAFTARAAPGLTESTFWGLLKVKVLKTCVLPLIHNIIFFSSFRGCSFYRMSPYFPALQQVSTWQTQTNLSLKVEHRN